MNSYKHNFGGGGIFYLMLMVAAMALFFKALGIGI